MLSMIDVMRTQIHCGLWGVRCGFPVTSLQDRDIAAMIALLADLDKLIALFRVEIAPEVALNSPTPPDEGQAQEPGALH